LAVAKMRLTMREQTLRKTWSITVLSETLDVATKRNWGCQVAKPGLKTAANSSFVLMPEHDFSKALELW